MKVRGTILVVAALVSVAIAGGAPPEGHPALQPRASADSSFPLYAPDSLALHGFPDHQHEFFWPGWKPHIDARGEAYGYGTFCQGLLDLDREGLEASPGLLRFGSFELSFNDTVPACYVSPFLGFCEIAQVDARELLGLEANSVLRMVNPDAMNIYTAMTGQGAWRMYQRDGDDVVLQPIHVLAQRSLIAHASRDLMLAWLLETNGGAELPAWFREGLAAWFAELGVHLNNYMAQFRPAGSPLLGPAEIEAILTGEIDEDPDRDRMMFRKARYSAFLMVWELVEHRGGLDAMRGFLQAVHGGEAPDAAATRLWGTDLATLAVQLDPTTRPEPLGDNVISRNPSRPPR